jgi:hypothetical protein
MKKATTVFSFLLLSVCLFAQTIEGDQLLTLLGKETSDPLFKQLKTQDKFFTDAWDENLSIYIIRTGTTITGIELQNGKKRQSTQERYGTYLHKLPLGLHWGMTMTDIEKIIGQPTLKIPAGGFNDYASGGWKLRVYYENEKPVSISFSKGTTPGEVKTPVKQPVAPTPPSTASTGDWLIKFDTTAITTEFNWPVLRKLIISTTNLKPMTGNDSVDYIGQVYYSTPHKAIGFARTAIKRRKKAQTWHYECFLKTSSDSNKVRNLFFSIYDALKKTMKDNTGDDFILASSAREPISAETMNWLAQWTLYSNYKGLVPGLGKIRIALLLTGMDNAFKKGQRDYTLKFFIMDKDTEIDFFTWDTPRQ